MSVDENKANLQRMVAEVWNKGNLELIPELCSSDYLEPAGNRDIKGHDGIRNHVNSLRNSFHDFTMQIDEIVGEGDTLAARLTWSGIFLEKIWGFEPNGKQILVKEAMFFRFLDGKQIEAIPFTDLSSLFQQMSSNP